MRGQENISYSNHAAGTIGPFTVYGGYYQFSAKATWGGGNVQLNQLGADGTTYVANGAAITADGVQYVYLPPGSVQFVITTATASYGKLVRIPISE